ncbi:MAG TPA: hypothetical protein VGQ33_13825, partial [Vicinamibacteria bacterium]|nr:hypothetical protein [Vicinamibacteria bacterium]
MTGGVVPIGIDSLLWRRFVGGGHLRDAAVLPLPALRRTGGARVAVDARVATAANAPLMLSVDDGPSTPTALDPARRAWVEIPARAVDGAEVRLSGEGPVVLSGLRVAARPEWERAGAAGVAVALVTFLLLLALPRAAALGLASFVASGTVFGCVPGWILLAWPGAAALARLALPLLVALAALAVALRPAGSRPRVTRLALLMAAGLFGCWVRAFFLPSAGSWDVDYWRTAMLQASTRGIGSAYGGPDDVPPGHLRAQLTGRERVSAPN